ncbi:nucleotide disphospho-sugar-binding domain-containing protein [Sphaerisporangium sp. NPDC049002]|uniref:glycosyltransferase n=1 Tax=unclassified Sphaerisporangium TaxID=2630420 RepID=UPI0033D7F1D6
MNAARAESPAFTSGRGARQPPRFARPGTPRLPHEHHIKPLLYDLLPGGDPCDLPPDGDARDLPPDGERAGPAVPPRGRPLVYATLGTMYNKATSVFGALAEAFDGQDYDVLMTTGPDCDPESVLPGGTPANVRLARYVPHSAVFRRCDVVISHGGFSTVMCALAESVPLGLIPLGSDHGTNARRCAALGAALVYPRCVLEPYLHVAPEDVDPGLVREMTATLLAEASYRAAARTVAAEVAALPGPDHAVRLIEDLLKP